jgi:hypothetical protein
LDSVIEKFLSVTAIGVPVAPDAADPVALAADWVDELELEPQPATTTALATTAAERRRIRERDAEVLMSRATGPYSVSVWRL